VRIVSYLQLLNAWTSCTKKGQENKTEKKIRMEEQKDSNKETCVEEDKRKKNSRK